MTERSLYDYDLFCFVLRERAHEQREGQRRERDRETERDRDRENPKQAPDLELSVQSLMRGSNP